MPEHTLTAPADPVLPADPDESAVGELTAHRLRVDGLERPLGLGNRRPEFGWRLAGRPGSVQAGYEIEVGTGGPAATTLWRDRRDGSTDQVGIRYQGPELESATAYRWRVRLTDANGRPGSWSPWATFETGLLDPADWSARWVGADDDDPATVRPIYLRGAIDVPAGVVRARAYASALGWYRLLVDGTDLTGPALVPRFTSFDHEIEYQAYDITEAVRPGTARIDLVVADGRFRGTLGMHNRRQVYGGRLGGLVQVLFELADGSRVWAGSDAGWLAATGPIVFADPKLGETIDLRIPSPCPPTPTGCRGNRSPCCPRPTAGWSPRPPLG